MTDDEKDFKQGLTVMKNVLRDLTDITDKYEKQNIQATAAAFLSVTRDLYYRAHSTDTVAMMFYRLADEAATAPNRTRKNK